MRFSEQWLREWVDPAISTEELAEQLTMAGLEVESIETSAPPFAEVVVGEIVLVQPHPDAEKLRVCQVDVGRGSPLTIVCGAANARVDLKIPAALVGATLPGGLVIKKAKLRGVESFGMLCSAKELGIADTSEGLMELPDDAPVGEPVRDYLGLDDKIIELKLTPNRGDCLGIEGIAREVGVITGQPINAPTLGSVPADIDDTFPIGVTAPADCPRYVGRVVKGLDPKASTPLWMRELLRRSGLRSLNPIVDVTNFVLLELGQPMHAFDLDRLRGGIEVRRAREGERLRLLNGQEITLDGESLVIADGKAPVALAGIMGGADSAVDETTTSVFLESAYFAPSAIAGRGRRYGIHTDSSHRFERGVSYELQERAIERATALLIAIAGGEAGPVIDVVHRQQMPQRRPILLRRDRVERVLGASIPDVEVERILVTLGMSVDALPIGWTVTAPAHRFDIAIEEDLIEELARVYGYGRLPSTHPITPMSMAPMPSTHVELMQLKQLLVERGYYEAITYSFVEPRLQRLLDPQCEPIALANPISADMAVMRTNLWAGLAQALLFNLNRQQGRVRLFETGQRFIRKGTETVQESVLGGLAYGSAYPEQWGMAERAVDFFDIKGDVENLLRPLGARASIRFIAASHPALHPGQCARILVDGVEAGWMGMLHPSVQRALDLPRPAFLFEISLEVFDGAHLPSFSEVSRFPAMRRDIALVVPRELTVASLLDAVTATAPGILEELQLFDVYTGEGIDPGRKSIALGLTFRECSRTLTDLEVDAAVDSVVTALASQFGATLRV